LAPSYLPADTQQRLKHHTRAAAAKVISAAQPAEFATATGDPVAAADAGCETEILAALAYGILW
jgi:hypothetical protein